MDSKLDKESANEAPLQFALQRVIKALLQPTMEQYTFTTASGKTKTSNVVDVSGFDNEMWAAVGAVELSDDEGLLPPGESFCFDDVEIDHTSFSGGAATYFSRHGRAPLTIFCLERLARGQCETFEAWLRVDRKNVCAC
eukprot:Selendium_serpulae@DN6373_c1_g1_i12.p1